MMRRNVDAVADVCSGSHLLQTVTDTLATRLREALGPDYTLERELGGAGMSRVFVAAERALGRRVVVKVLPPDLAAGVNMERFRREIQLAAQLQHPHVVPLLTAGERGDLLWFTMPFIEGESLRVTLDRRAKLPVREVLRILHDVVDALAYAHSRGVVHRDIKPGNILMSGAHAVVTDFGVAKALSVAIPVAGHTTSGMAIGTPAYMAPEQLAADPAADHRVDIYAIGLLAYELLTGTAPFAGSSPQATLAAQLTVRPTAPHIAQPDVPQPLSKIIMQCLEKDAAKRPQTATELLAQIDLLRDNSNGDLERTSRSRSTRGALLGVFLIVTATVVFTLTRSGADAGDTATNTRDSISEAAAAETVLVFRDVPVGRDAAQGITLPLGITSAESLAIARGVQSRLGVAAAVGAAEEAIDIDSLVAAISRVFADSTARAISRMEAALSSLPQQQQLQTIVMQATERRNGVADTGTARSTTFRSEPFGAPRPPGERGFPQPPMDSARIAAARASAVSAGVPLMAPPAEGRHRLVMMALSNRTRDTLFNTLGAALHDSVAAALRSSRGGRLEIIPAEEVARTFGSQPPRATSVGFSLRANFVLSGVYFLRNDSLVLVTVLTDVQGGEGTRLHETVVPVAERQSALAPATRWVRARLDSLRREMTRRPPGGPGFERR